jgi:hypothetical protein
MARQFGRNVPPCERRPVAWYAPGVLWQAGREWVQSADFQRNLDRREMFSPVLTPVDLSRRQASAADPFWFDFMSDTGDGGDATFTVAQALLAPALEVDAPAGGPRMRLPEGELLVFGGDLAYPGASALEYQYRFIEMLSTAHDPAGRFVVPGGSAGRAFAPRKFIVAIPQNHDWFDSASTFCRYFVNYDQGAVIGARTPQRQTYFATRLPHGWWVLGLDFALVGDLDRQQFEAFAALLSPDADAGIAPGDDVLLVYPEPYWTRPLGDGAAAGYPRRYQRLEALIEARGARIRLRLAGDLHLYSRDTLARDPLTGLDSHLIICGSGGAFLHPTHSAQVQAAKVVDRSDEPQAATPDLGRRVRAGIADARPEPLSPGARSVRGAFAHAVDFPPPQRTRVLALANLWALLRVRFSRSPWALGPVAALGEIWNSNLGFAICLGTLYGFNAYVNSGVFSASYRPDGFAPMAQLAFGAAAWLWLKAMVFSPFAAFVNLFMLAGCVNVAWEGPAPKPLRVLGGLSHGMAHAFLIFALYWLACHLLTPRFPAWAAVPGPLRDTVLALSIWVAVGLAGIALGGLLFGAYLALACAGFSQLPNGAFGSLACPHHKGFLRFQLSPDGLEVFMLGIDEVPRRASASEPVPPGWRLVDHFRMPKAPLSASNPRP